MLLNFVDKSFNINKITHYRLSIQITLNGFSFCVFDTSLSKHVVLRDFQYKKNVLNYDDLDLEISTIFAEDSLLKLNYPVCSCTFVSTKSTLVPSLFFSEIKLRSFLEFIVPLDDLDEIHYHQIDRLDAYAVFALPSLIVSKLNGLYKTVRYYSQCLSLLLNNINNLSRPNCMLLNLCDGMMDVILIADNKLKLQNIFEVKHLNDAVYYLTAILNEIADNNFLIPTFISGDIINDEIEELLGYFPSLKVENDHRMSKLVGYENSYRYFNLLKAHECE